MDFFDARSFGKYVSNGLSGCGIIDANVFPMLLKYLQKELAIILESEIMSLFSLNFSLIELSSFDFPMIDLRSFHVLRMSLEYF